jgi:hypothetical protein
VRGLALVPSPGRIRCRSWSPTRLAAQSAAVLPLRTALAGRAATRDRRRSPCSLIAANRMCVLAPRILGASGLGGWRGEPAGVSSTAAIRLFVRASCDGLLGPGTWGGIEPGHGWHASRAEVRRTTRPHAHDVYAQDARRARPRSDDCRGARDCVVAPRGSFAGGSGARTPTRRRWGRWRRLLARFYFMTHQPRRLLGRTMPATALRRRAAGRRTWDCGRQTEGALSPLPNHPVRHI